MTYENEEIKKTMSMDKERLHCLEAALEELHKKGKFKLCSNKMLSKCCSFNNSVLSSKGDDVRILQVSKFHLLALEAQSVA